MRRKMLIGLGVLCLLGVAVGGGFYAGREAGISSVDVVRIRRAAASGAEVQAYDRGYRDGQIDAQATERIAREEALRRARARFDRRVADEAERAFTAGWNAVFEGFDGNWAPGFYIVEVVGSDEPGATFEMRSRLPMARGEVYSICDDNRGICGGAYP